MAVTYITYSMQECLKVRQSCPCAYLQHCSGRNSQNKLLMSTETCSFLAQYSVA